MVSVLVPIFNSSKYLRDCIQSIVEQTFADLQIVLIDDGSIDDSMAVMRMAAENDKRIEIYHQDNKGVSATRNRLLTKVKGDFILFVDSDDWIEPNTIDLLVSEQLREDYDVVAFQMYGSQINHEGSFERQQIIKLFLEHFLFNGSLCNKMFRASLFKGLSFEESISYGEDALFVWQLLQRIEKVVVLNQHLYHIESNSDSISRRLFDGKKCSAYKVWETICRDVERLWPEFHDLAHARFACEMTKILRDAVLDGYNDYSQIKLLQQEIRKDCHLIGSKTGISTSRMRHFAWMVSHSYSLTCFLSRYIKFY